MDVAFADQAARAHRAAPFVATLLAAATALAGLTLAHSVFSTYSAYLPWGITALAAIALALVLIGTRRRDVERPSVVPPLIGLLLVVSVVPVLQAGAELIVNRTTASDFVDRRTGTDVSMLDVSALALRTALPAPSDTEGRKTWFYAIRDDAADPRIALVRSPVTPASLDDRTVTGRIIEASETVAGASKALSRHGWLAGGTSLALGDRYLAEVNNANDAKSVGTVSELTTVPANSLVRVPLVFRGQGVATCEAVGKACDATVLARGDGGFLQIANDASGAAILVRTAYPATDAPFHAVGPQRRDSGELNGELQTALAQHLLGWGDVLSLAYVDQDPALPVDRAWIVPLLFVILSALLLIGLRVGYPVFVVEASGAAALAPTGLQSPQGSTQPVGVTRIGVPALVSGRLARPRGGPLDVESVPGELRPPPSAAEGPVLLIHDHDAVLELALPPQRASLTSLTRGAVHGLGSSRPALWIHWFGSDARLVFANESELARAQTMLAALH